MTDVEGFRMFHSALALGIVSLLSGRGREGEGGEYSLSDALHIRV